MAFAMAAMLPACSSSEEAEDSDTGGVPCDIDPMQEGCSKEDIDT